MTFLFRGAIKIHVSVANGNNAPGCNSTHKLMTFGLSRKKELSCFDDSGAFCGQ